MLEILHNADISRLTTFRLPAVTKELVFFDTAEDLCDFFASDPKHPIFILGGGSNILFTTGRFDGTILSPRSNSYSFSEPATDGKVILNADAGCILELLCEESTRRGLWGLENLSGIPGCVGGAAVQNVGAYGTEFKDVAMELKVFDITTLSEITIPASECMYDYRSSIFKFKENAGRYIILSAAISLSLHPNPKLEYSALARRFADADTSALVPSMLRQEVLSLRDSKLPDQSTIGSAGSFFKNPVVSADFYKKMGQRMNMDIPAHTIPSGEYKLSAAWLIDKAGCKTFSSGGAALWHSQPLVIVNATGHATGEDVVKLENMIRCRVEESFGISLSPEVIHI